MNFSAYWCPHWSITFLLHDLWIIASVALWWIAQSQRQMPWTFVIKCFSVIVSFSVPYGYEWKYTRSGRTHNRRSGQSCCVAYTMKTLREKQTLCTGCSKVEPKFFAPLQTPFPGVQDSQNLISWRWSLPLPTNPVWWGSMHATSSYHGNRPTNTHTHKQTNPQTGLITMHCAAAS